MLLDSCKVTKLPEIEISVIDGTEEEVFSILKSFSTPKPKVNVSVAGNRLKVILVLFMLPNFTL